MLRFIQALIGFLPLFSANFALTVEAANSPGPIFRKAPVKRGSLRVTVQARGTLEPVEIVDVGAQVAGQIEKLGPDPQQPGKTVDFGTRVERGTVLAQIDPTLYRIQVEQARARLQQAEAGMQLKKVKLRQAEGEWQRAKKLEAQKVISLEQVQVLRSRHEENLAEVEAGMADVRLAQANLKLAELNLDYTTIRSPEKGVVIDRRVNVGQTVRASLEAPSLFLIARDLKNLKFWISVNESEIPQVREGQAVRFTVDAFPRRVFTARISQVRLNATRTQNVVTFTVVADVDNSEEKLVPYLSANAEIMVGERKDILLLPNAALRWRPTQEQVAEDIRDKFGSLQGEKEIVWVEDQGHVRPIKVRLGLSDGKATEVVAGDLKEGTPVVIGILPAGSGKE